VIDSQSTRVTGSSWTWKKKARVAHTGEYSCAVLFSPCSSFLFKTIPSESQYELSQNFLNYARFRFRHTEYSKFILFYSFFIHVYSFQTMEFEVPFILVFVTRRFPIYAPGWLVSEHWFRALRCDISVRAINLKAGRSFYVDAQILLSSRGAVGVAQWALMSKLQTFVTPQVLVLLPHTVLTFTSRKSSRTGKKSALPQQVTLGSAYLACFH
jgi:hypothetical protein